MQLSGPAKVYRLNIVPPPMEDFLETPAEHIQSSIAPGKRATRYGREWIVGKTEFDGQYLLGRFGYRGESGVAEIFDEELQDFVELATPSGLTVPFAIDTFALEVAAQPRGKISANSIASAITALLNTSGMRWKVLNERQKVTLDEWKTSVVRVTAVRFTIREPNPHYHDAHNLEDLMKQLESEVIQLEARNENGGLDLDAPFLRETEGHVARGYGDAEYQGVKMVEGEPRTTRYSTSVGSEEEAQAVEVDASSGEVAPSTLRHVLAEKGGEDELDSSLRSVGGELAAPDAPKALEA
jgi:hypothetical protein